MDSPLSFWQRFSKAILSEAAFEDMKKSSDSWKVQCPNCKYERSVWEMGGIRWKAAGNPKMLRGCPNCNQQGWHLIYQKPI
ncbi:MAG: hypothetical protein IPO22_00115 [Anaerolineales bacterium]|jgi:hypothetical protein|nr:hypothetical protein [Anaerolineales bacterium]